MHVIYVVKSSVKHYHIISVLMHCEKELITKRSESEVGLCVILIQSLNWNYVGKQNADCFLDLNVRQ